MLSGLYLSIVGNTSKVCMWRTGDQGSILLIQIYRATSMQMIENVCLLVLVKEVDYLKTIMWMFFWSFSKYFMKHFLFLCVMTTKLTSPIFRSTRTHRKRRTDRKYILVHATIAILIFCNTVTQMTSAGCLWVCSPFNQPGSDYWVVGVLHLLSMVVGNADPWWGKAWGKLFGVFIKGL